MHPEHTPPTADATPRQEARTELRDLPRAGEELSSDEIARVVGGLRSCPVTKPRNDDFSCIDRRPD